MIFLKIIIWKKILRNEAKICLLRQFCGGGVVCIKFVSFQTRAHLAFQIHMPVAIEVYSSPAMVSSS
jgi:hypothetical protein